MPGSGAQLNRWSQVLLSNLTTATTAVAAPTVAYGTTGVNDSGQFSTPIGFSKYAFMMTGGGTAYAVSLYGCIDQNAIREFIPPGGSVLGQPGFVGTTTDPTTTVPATSWFLLPGTAESTGTGVMTNPLVPATPFLYVSMPLIAVRAVLTTIGTGGSVNILAFAIP